MTTLGPICSFLNGGTPSRGVARYYQGDVPWITGADISGPQADTARSFITEEAIRESATNRVPAGTVLLVTRTSVGKVAVAAMELCFSQDITAITPDPHCLDTSYLVHFLRTKQPHLERLARGATIKGVTRETVANLEIPVLSLPEQRRIAAILDKADALRAKRRQALAQLDTLLQSTFLDMFGDPVTNPMGWEQCVVGDIVHAVKDGPHVSPTYAESGVPFLSTRHIKPGEVVWEDLKYIDQDEANRQWKKCKPEFGDILYTKGGTTGIAARVTTSEPFAVWVHVALLKPIVNKVHPIWIEAMLNSAYCYTQSQRYTHGIANRDLGLKRMVKIQMYLPPLAEQRCFAAIVESIEQQKVSQRVHFAELDTLFASLQQRAFRGEL
ncbi:MAG: restriction endonuclease subunit S [Chloroflexi bacterium]|nr:restriction endonuclease subunit S [Chloroflexota bacterium]